MLSVNLDDLWWAPCSFYNTALPGKVQRLTGYQGKKEKLTQSVEPKVLLRQSVRNAQEEGREVNPCNRDRHSELPSSAKALTMVSCLCIFSCLSLLPPATPTESSLKAELSPVHSW